MHRFRRFDIAVIKQKDTVVEDVLVGGIQRGALLHREGALLEVALGLVVLSHNAPWFRFVWFQSTRYCMKRGGLCRPRQKLDGICFRFDVFVLQDGHSLLECHLVLFIVL